jgi:hypothetical protein
MKTNRNILIIFKRKLDRNEETNSTAGWQKTKA